MSLRIFTLTFLIILAAPGLNAQQTQDIKLSSPTGFIKTIPGKLINISLFIENTSNTQLSIHTNPDLPKEWKIVLPLSVQPLKPKEKKLQILSIRIPSGYPAGNYNISIHSKADTSDQISTSTSIEVVIGEVQNISMSTIQSPSYIKAGENMTAEFLLQNQGNTTQKIFIETRNCQTEGSPEIKISPGESINFSVYQSSSEDLTNISHQNFSVRASINATIIESIFKTYIIFPVKEKKQDLYFRYPVKLSTSYLASNLNGRYEHIIQAEMSGSGPVDTQGKHHINFLARHSGSKNISHLGLHDQYYISYENKNFELLVGENSYMFTPLTESSRYGLGIGTKAKLNNGLNFGFLYVKPKMYEGIKNEMAVFSGIEFNDYNKIDLFLISKESLTNSKQSQLASLTAKTQPFKATSAEIEYSFGKDNEASDHALRFSINSNVSILNLSGDYFYTGTNYPGYFSNSTFYSGNLSVRITKNLNLGIFAREDFKNAQLDTFFMTAPYSKSFRSSLNYKIAQRSHVRLYWNQNERKDRLSLEKFHYKTNSFNAQYNHTIKKFEYNVLGEFGETTNFLLNEEQNRHYLARGLLNLSYRFNSYNAIRLFGNYTNINRFISPGQQNLSAGISALIQISKHLKADLHLQNSYAIEDYYRNRNLMQFNLNYIPNTNHGFSFRSFYTLFRQKTEDPELTLSLNYTYKFGIPLKKILNAGELRGNLTNDNGAPVEGVIVSIANKTAISDKHGFFVFKSIPAGRKHLIIDKSSLAIDELPEISEHLEVNIPDNDVLSLHLKVTKGAKMSGQFVLQQENSGIFRKDSVNIQNIIVELSGKNDSFRITSDRDGKFFFPMVRPGEWTFKIYPNNLPEGYEVEEQLMKFNLNPGDSHFQNIVLKPIKRKIIFKPAGDGLQLLKPKNNN